MIELGRAVKRGDGIAHKFNKETHTNLDELLASLNVVRAEPPTKDAFRRIAKIWKNRLCGDMDWEAKKKKFSK
jgi:hypothetical protein